MGYQKIDLVRKIESLQVRLTRERNFSEYSHIIALGDSFELTHLHKRQFVALLKHCNLLNSDFTSAQATIVYAHGTQSINSVSPNSYEPFITLHEISSRIMTMMRTNSVSCSRSTSCVSHEDGTTRNDNVARPS